RSQRACLAGLVVERAHRVDLAVEGRCPLVQPDEGEGQVVDRGRPDRLDGLVATLAKGRHPDGLGQLVQPVMVLAEQRELLRDAHDVTSVFRERRKLGLPVRTVRASSKAERMWLGQAANLRSGTLIATSTYSVGSSPSARMRSTRAASLSWSQSTRFGRSAITVTAPSSKRTVPVSLPAVWRAAWARSPYLSATAPSSQSQTVLARRRASAASSCKRTSCSAGRAAMSPTAMRRSSSREMRLEIVITTPSCRRLAGVVGGARPDLLALVLLDVFEAIHDATAELDVLRAFTRPAPAFQRAMRNVPASGQLDLGEVSGSHLVLRGSLRKPEERMAQDQNCVVGIGSGSSGDQILPFLRVKGDRQGDGEGMMPTPECEKARQSRA